MELNSIVITQFIKLYSFLYFITHLVTVRYKVGGRILPFSDIPFSR